MDRHLVEINLGVGVGEQVAGKKSKGLLKRLENARFNHEGEIEKRRGHTDLGVYPSLTGWRLMSRGGSELLMVDDQYLKAYSPGKAAFYTKGYMPECTVRERQIAGGMTTFRYADVASDGKYLYACWETSVSLSAKTEIYICVYDPESGTEIVSNKQVLSSTPADSLGRPRLVLVGTQAPGGSGTVILVYQNVSAGTIQGRTVSSAGALGSETTLATAATIYFEASAISDRFFIAYQTGSGGSALLRLQSFNAALAVVTAETTIDSTHTTYGTIGMDATSSNVWITYSKVNGGNVDAKYLVANPTSLAVTSGPTTLISSATYTTTRTAIRQHTSSSQAVAYVELSGSSITNGQYTTARVVNTSGAIVDGGTLDKRACANTQLASTPFDLNGQFGAWCFYYAGICQQLAGSTLVSQSLVLVNVKSTDISSAGAVLPRPVAMCLPRSTKAEEAAHSAPCRATTIAAYPDRVYTLGRTIDSGTGRAGLSLIEVNLFEETIGWGRVSETGGACYFDGGLVTQYAGGNSVELNFLHGPDVIDGADTGAGSIPDGDYFYVACYAFVDETGAIHRSSPSIPKKVTYAGGGSAGTIRVPGYQLTMRDSYDGTTTPTNFVPHVFVEVYRTTLNNSGPYYRIGADGDQYVCRAGVADVVIEVADNNTDSAITSNPQLYTGLNGTAQPVQPHAAPPSLMSLQVWKGSLAGIAPNGRDIWISNPHVENEGMTFVDGNAVIVDDTDRVYALKVMDDKLVAFSRNAIHVVEGLTPDNGGNNMQAESRRVATDVGCVNPNSIALTPMGLVFQPAGGGYPYLLDRGLNVNSAFGQPVIDTFATNTLVTAAMVHPTEHTLLMTARPDITSDTGVRVVFDYTYGQWSVDAITVGTDSDLESMTAVGSDFYVLNHNGTILKESQTSYLDIATWVTLLAETQEIQLSTIGGWQRVWKVSLIGTSYTGHDLSFSTVTSYDSALTDTTSYTAAELATFSVYQVEKSVRYPRGESIRVTVQDATPTSGGVGTGRGAAWASLVLECGAMNGRMRLPAAQKK